MQGAVRDEDPHPLTHVWCHGRRRSWDAWRQNVLLAYL